MQNKNTRAIIRSEVPADAVPLRGASGKLYGYFNPKTLTIEFKAQRGGTSGQNSTTERIDLKPLMLPE